MSAPVPRDFVTALHELGLAPDAPLHGEALAGGVSSDIWRIDLAGGSVCAKRALPKLKVAADWQAPIERNVFEARWMQVANEALPGSAPRLLGQHARLGVLAMEWLAPQHHELWKARLRSGDVRRDDAVAVARTLAAIHRHAAARPDLAQAFPTDRIFHDIRLEPYLVATAARHPELADALHALVRTTASTPRTLVHGDVSPKNILLRDDGRPVLLDAECAWWGDPAFDLAFCLNHLLLKCLWVPAATASFLDGFDALTRAYLDGVDWEPRDAIEARAARLLPGLLLARVDGKSPVEYVDRDELREVVQRTARSLLRHPVDEMAAVRRAWEKELPR